MYSRYNQNHMPFTSNATIPLNAQEKSEFNKFTTKELQQIKFTVLEVLSQM